VWCKFTLSLRRTCPTAGGGQGEALCIIQYMFLFASRFKKVQ
jgi:hypothetical protein